MVQKKRNSSDEGAVGTILTTLQLIVESADDALTNWTVDESYALSVHRAAAVLRAPTPFGALRGLESFYQLVAVAVNGQLQLPRDAIEIADAPTFAHRSVLIDVGRRLYPLSFVRSIIDAMSYAKLNVLHLHLSDFGRFAWESRVFPELNVGYRGDGTYWTQEEVRALIDYARLRGVRLVPEIEMSTHAKALLPLVATQGLTFCNLSFPAVLYDDPAGKTVSALKKLLAEMAGLFDDDVLHVGMDEAQVMKCSRQRSAVGNEVQ
jgi:hexosaminidase